MSTPTGRFSTLKVFQFSKSSFKSDSNLKPPTPPPKDSYYNRSLTSLALSPDSLSLPPSPLSPHRPPGPSQSTMSLVSAAPSNVTGSSPSPISKKGFFKFARRSTKSPLKSPSLKSSASYHSLHPPDTPDDEGISRPWNFQHHIHVDESYTGLPPSWSASLADAGFTQEEISAIRNRRSPGSSYLFPNSPVSLVTQPLPRSTSLPLHTGSTSQTRPPLPTAQSTPIPSRRKASSESNRQMSDPSSSSLHISRDADESFVLIENRSTQIKNGHTYTPSIASRASSRSRSRASSNASTHDVPPLPPQPLPPQVPLPPTPCQPSKLGYNTMSPPPPYDSALQRDKVQKKTFPPPHLSSSGSRRRNIGDGNSDESPGPSGDLVSSARPPSKTSIKKLTSLPPRLSFHDDNDLSSWSEALISAIPTELSAIQEVSASVSSSTTSKFAEAQAAHVSPSPLLPSTDLPISNHSPPTILTARPSSSRRIPPQRSIPPIVLNECTPSQSPIDNQTPESAKTPIWDELLGMVRKPDDSGDPWEGEVDGEGSGEGLSVDRGSNRDSSRSSVSTVTHATIVRNVSVAKRAVASVIERAPSKNKALLEEDEEEEEEEVPGTGPLRPTLLTAVTSRHPGSPHSSHFGSEESLGSSSSRSHDHETPLTEAPETPGPAYLDTSLPSKPTYIPIPRHSLLISASETFGGDDVEDDSPMTQRPTIVISDILPTAKGLSPCVTSASPTPVTPTPRYQGWLSKVVKPLETFIDELTNPREHYVDLREIGEGESGSVYAARVIDAHKLKLPPVPWSKPDDDSGKGKSVAIKNVPILPVGSSKLKDLERELSLMKGIRHEFILGMDALYVDLVEDSLWIRMELMERSLADVVALVNEGLMVQERMMARFASDVLMALDYLQTYRISHRDLRSDNLLLNIEGVLKIADFSNAVRLTPEQPMCYDAAGVIYWQAPEVRTGSYDPLKVDVWSLGATVWEMAEAQPPFSNIQDPRQIGNQWPPLTRPEIYSRSLHDFLRSCSQASSSRPSPHDLLDTPFIRNACGRQVIIHTLSQCRTIEEKMLQGDGS